jgi:hypothetical protein
MARPRDGPSRPVARRHATRGRGTRRRRPATRRTPAAYHARDRATRVPTCHASSCTGCCKRVLLRPPPTRPGATRCTMRPSPTAQRACAHCARRASTCPRRRALDGRRCMWPPTIRVQRRSPRSCRAVARRTVRDGRRADARRPTAALELTMCRVAAMHAHTQAATRGAGLRCTLRRTASARAPTDARASAAASSRRSAGSACACYFATATRPTSSTCVAPRPRISRRRTTTPSRCACSAHTALICGRRMRTGRRAPLTPP